MDKMLMNKLNDKELNMVTGGGKDYIDERDTFTRVVGDTIESVDKGIYKAKQAVKNGVKNIKEGVRNGIIRFLGWNIRAQK